MERVEETITDETGQTFRRTVYYRRKAVKAAGIAEACDGYLDVPSMGVPPGSMFILSGTGEGYWLAPGAPGDTLRIVGGVPTWAP